VAKFFENLQIFPLDFSTPFFCLKMKVLKKYPETTNFRQFPLSFCQKVAKKRAKSSILANPNVTTLTSYLTST